MSESTVSDTTPPDLTWPALLARWMHYAQVTGRLPPTIENDRWRAAAAPIITLQAVAFAVADLGRLPVSERAEALDKARMLVNKQGRLLTDLWSAQPPSEISLLISDALAAVSAASATPPPCGYPLDGPTASPDSNDH